MLIFMVPLASSAYIHAMANRPDPKPDNQEQLERFKQTAREVGVDETPGAFDKAFNSVIPQRSAQPQEAPQKPAPRRSPGPKPTGEK